MGCLIYKEIGLLKQTYLFAVFSLLIMRYFFWHVVAVGIFFPQKCKQQREEYHKRQMEESKIVSTQQKHGSKIMNQQGQYQ